MSRSVILALVGMLSIACSTVSFASDLRPQAPVPPVPGPQAFSTAEYKFPAQIDKDVLATEATEIWARAFWPNDLSTPRPIVFLLHGNHSTCGQGNPRIDVDCTYTHEGMCPAGQTIAPNHEGFSYLAQQLASLGYIAVTINSNRGISCGSGTDADWGLNLARGRLVLRHIEEWMQWATQGGAPSSLGVSPDAFIGKVDFTNVGLMGHSRGGEGVRSVISLYREAGSIWPARVPNLKIRGVFEIASVDGQSGRVLNSEDTAWNQLLPMCDGDVTDLQGRLPFERMLTEQKETRKTPKSLTMVYGTNHNFFNSEWKADEGSECFEHKEVHGPGPTSQTQQTIAATELSAFMLANVGADKQPEMGRLFDPSYQVPSSLTSITRIDRDHVYTFDRLFSQVVDDFDLATGTSSNHKANSAVGIKIKNAQLEVPPRAEVSWQANAAPHSLQLNWTDAGTGRDLANFSSLDFRIGRPMDVVKDAATDLSVQLVDAAGHATQKLSVLDYTPVSGPGSVMDLYQTVRIPLKNFAITAGTKIRGVRFVFDRSPKGHLNFANVRFTSNNPTLFATTSNLPIAPLTIIPIKKDENDEDSELSNTQATAKTPPPPVTPSVPASQGPPQSPPPITNAPKLVSNAIVLQTRAVKNSKFLSGRPAVEITVGAWNHLFPVEAQLPTLVMSGNLFSVSRYPDTGKTDMLIFSIPFDDWTGLPNRGGMRVQYGRNHPSKYWQMHSYDKSELMH